MSYFKASGYFRVTSKRVAIFVLALIIVIHGGFLLGKIGIRVAALERKEEELRRLKREFVEVQKRGVSERKSRLPTEILNLLEE